MLVVTGLEHMSTIQGTMGNCLFYPQGLELTRQQKYMGNVWTSLIMSQIFVKHLYSFALYTPNKIEDRNTKMNNINYSVSNFSG